MKKLKNSVPWSPPWSPPLLLALLCLAGCQRTDRELAPSQSGISPMFKSEDTIARFRERVGLDRLILEGGDSIAADWDRLAVSLAPVLGSLEPLPAGSPVLLSPGVTSRRWQWEGENRHVTVAVYVTPTPAAAADKLVELVSVNTMATIPYEAGPKGLGDLAVRDTPEPAESLVWIYRNVCATVESLGGDPAPGDIAARVQEFMAGYRVDDLTGRPPAP